jgi:peptide/nickel transport system permease protein
MNRTVRHVLVRVALVIPQMLALTAVVFLLVRLLPGDPVIARLGGFAPDAAVESLTKQLGLDQPIHIQYIQYMNALLHGDLGDSWRTAQPVMLDLKLRLPATLELLLLGMGLAAVVGMGLGVITALAPGGLVDRVTLLYGLLAGALPEFYIGLILIYVFFHLLGIAPNPAGRLSLLALPPPRVTGMYLIDSALAGQWDTFRDAASHLVLPVATLAFWQAGAILKMTRSTMLQILDGDFVAYARVVGLEAKFVRRYAFRNALPPVISLTITIFAILLGAVVLIEQVFSWGGLGQYSVQSVTSSDWEAITGFLMLASTISLLLFVVMDMLYAIIDPRVEL